MVDEPVLCDCCGSDDVHVPGDYDGHEPLLCFECTELHG